jgi:cell division protein FtsB
MPKLPTASLKHAKRWAVPVVLACAVAGLQYQLWWGNSSHPRNEEMRAKLAQQSELNAQSKLANQQLEAEIADLQDGLNMVEERARMELGLVKPNEIMVQVQR